MSPFSRGRGLKSAFADDFKTALAVALFTRAWIEILARTDGILRVTVALFTRAWIEIPVSVSITVSVASPFSRGRGLK